MTAYVSVIGWADLFSAGGLSVIFMFSIVEICKIVASLTLHWHWKQMPTVHKWLLVSMIVVTMMITSVGIFGFLSKAHLEQGTPATYAVLKVERIDDRILAATAMIETARNRLDQLDGIVNKLIEYDKISRKTGAIAIKKSQADERLMLRGQIATSNNDIDDLSEKKYETQLLIAKSEAKLGPIKYIIDVFQMEDKKDSAVQIIIMIAIFVFDPFAIALLLAGLWSFKHRSRKEDGTGKSAITERDDGLVDVYYHQDPTARGSRVTTLSPSLQNETIDVNDIEPTVKKPTSIDAPDIEVTNDKKSRPGIWIKK